MHEPRRVRVNGVSSAHYEEVGGGGILQILQQSWVHSGPTIRGRCRHAPALKVSSYFSGRALIPRGVHSIRCKKSLKGGLMPHVNEWHELLKKVRLEQQMIVEAHVRPRERREADQEVVVPCAKFPWGQAKLKSLVFAWHDSQGAEF